MAQAWEREQMGLSGLEQDVKAVYDWVRSQLSNHKEWLMNEITKIRGDMATYEQAANDALAAMRQQGQEIQDLTSQLKDALANNDNSAAQAAADSLEAAAQSILNHVENTDVPAPSAGGTADDAPAVDNGNDVNAGNTTPDVGGETPVTPGGTDAPVPADTPAQQDVADTPAEVPADVPASDTSTDETPSV